METVGIAPQSEFAFRMRQVYMDVSVVPQPPHTVSREPYLGAVTGGERRSSASRSTETHAQPTPLPTEGDAPWTALSSRPSPAATSRRRPT